MSTPPSSHSEWQVTHKLIPVKALTFLLSHPLTGSHGGDHVEVEGSFDNWSTRQHMQKSGKDFTIIKLLPPGVYQVKPAVIHCPQP